MLFDCYIWCAWRLDSAVYPVAKFIQCDAFSNAVETYGKFHTLPSNFAFHLEGKNGILYL